jgi:hypothetical protein
MENKHWLFNHLSLDWHFSNHLFRVCFVGAMPTQAICRSPGSLRLEMQAKK